MNPRQFFAACMQILGEEKLSKIWGVSQRQLYRFAADPMHCGDWAFNPLERLQETVKELKIYGREDIAAHGVRCLASTLGWTIQSPNRATRDVRHMEIIRAVTDYLDADERNVDFMELAEYRERLVEAVESHWVRKRSAAVSFRRSNRTSAHSQSRRWWWPFGAAKGEE